ncbi:MAG: 2-C-methyl-D-erythritol 2,4-cyclodiphosphate synthase, partial [Geminicoccaceae bacterium]
LKRVSDGVVGETIDRSGLFRAQTPQGFAYQPILDAHRRMKGRAMTDDAAVGEACGLPVTIVPGDETNLKVTEEHDLERAIRYASKGHRTRTGMGFDVHRLEPGDGLTLLGLTLPEPFCMIGHSDADVGLHAITDALLGAIAAGDIGSHFPPSDPTWKGAASTIFLEHASDLIRKADGLIEHIDVTLICERPKIGPHREAMVERLAELLQLSCDRVSVKATTTERLGFTGRGEGIAAQAVATVLLPS